MVTAEKENHGAMDLKKYDPLSQYILASGKDLLEMKFEAVENILGFPLPNSARAHRAWWSNDKTHVQAEDGWLSCGWRVASVNPNDEVVTFRKHEAASAANQQQNEKFGASSPGIVFEQLAREAMTNYFGKPLRHRRKEGWAKLFDFVSDDYEIVGDAKYMSMVKGKRLPPAKLSIIAEHVWMLESTKAPTQFLVFGNDKRVPEEWLKRYGKLVNSVRFYFIEESGNIIELKKQ